MPSIFDNQFHETKLSSGLQTYFPAYQRIDVAPGYLALRGWASLDLLVRESFEVGDVEGPIARVLVGMVLPSQHEEIIDHLRSEISPSEDESLSLRERAPQVREALKTHMRTQLASGIPTSQDRATLRLCVSSLTLVLLSCGSPRGSHCTENILAPPPGSTDP